MSDPRTVWPKVEPGTACPDCGAILHGYPCIHHADGCSVLKVVMGGADTGAVGERPQRLEFPTHLLETVGKALYGWGDEEPNEATGYTAVYEATLVAAALHAAGYRLEGSGGAVGEREEPPLDVERLARAMDGQLTNPPDRLHNARYVALRYARLSVNEGGVAPPTYEAIERLDRPGNRADGTRTESGGVAPVEPQEPQR